MKKSSDWALSERAPLRNTKGSPSLFRLSTEARAALKCKEAYPDPTQRAGRGTAKRVGGASREFATSQFNGFGDRAPNCLCARTCRISYLVPH